MNDFLKTNLSQISTIHFIGIGGIGMSGIAELFNTLGFRVQGSDIKSNAAVERLRAMGINIFIGHHSDNIQGADLVVVSSAIDQSNLEYVAAKELSIPIFKRARMLAELMRFKWGIAVAGTHGKTTTTSLVSHIMQVNNLDPTSIVGGIVNSWGGNTRFGNSNWVVAESDESDGSFLDLPAIISIVTNIEEEHMEFYKNYNNLKDYFIKFINSIPFYGFSILCMDDKGIQDILPYIKSTRTITYGISPQADFRALNVRYNNLGTIFDIEENNKNSKIIYKDFMLPMYGHHNVLNALSAIVLSLKIGINENDIKKSLESFLGINRRYTNIGSYKNINFIDDYAHHPSEIEAVINATMEILSPNETMLSIVQPHRYTRLKDHFDNFCKCFNKSHYVIVLDVYCAGEKPIKNINGLSLVEGMHNYGHKNVIYVDSSDKIKDAILHIKELSNDTLAMAVFMGAGDITTIAKDTLNNLNNN